MSLFQYIVRWSGFVLHSLGHQKKMNWGSSKAEHGTRTGMGGFVREVATDAQGKGGEDRQEGRWLMQDEGQVRAGDTRVSVLLVATAEMPESSDYWEGCLVLLFPWGAQPLGVPRLTCQNQEKAGLRRMTLREYRAASSHTRPVLKEEMSVQKRLFILLQLPLECPHLLGAWLWSLHFLWRASNVGSQIYTCVALYIARAQEGRQMAFPSLEITYQFCFEYSRMFFLKIYFYFLTMCIYISWGWVHAHEDRCLLGPDKGTGSLGARVMDNCEQPSIGSGTRTQVLYKTSTSCTCWAISTVPCSRPFCRGL